MRPLNTLFIGAWVLIIGSCPAASFAIDPSLLKNDKEATTHAFNSLELWTAKRKIGNPGIGSTSEAGYRILIESLSELEKTESLCDLDLIQRMRSKFTMAGIPSNHETLINLLILWRHENLIDDLMFEVLEQSSQLVESFNEPLIALTALFPEKTTNRLMKKKKIRQGDLEALYTPLNQFTESKLECALDAWLSLSSSLGFSNFSTDQISLLNRRAKSLGVLNESSFRIAEKMNEWNAQSYSLTLSKYLGLLKSVKNRYLSPSRTEADLKPNVLSSKLKDRHEKTSYRKSLYSRFNSIQISMISEVFRKTLNRMDATKAELVFTYESGSETIPISPMGQYYLARKLLRKELYELSQSSFFGGVGIGHEDLLTASLEMGLINSDMVESALKIDDLWNPEVKPWKKISDYAFRITGTATIFLPPPYNIISSIALVFVDGLITRKTTKPSQADPSYDFF